MGDQVGDVTGGGSERSEPARSRWSPKPEQILILESIFNSGMVNPPKDETVRIRKLLEKFGSVGDANVFYWFQNRRSRSRRRERQIQATLFTPTPAPAAFSSSANTTISDGGASATGAMVFGLSPSFHIPSPSYSESSSCLAGSSSSCDVFGNHGGLELELDDDALQFSGPSTAGFSSTVQNSAVTSMANPSFQYQTAGYMTVFINGVPTEIPKGPLDMKAMFGQGFVLVHSSGMPVPLNEFGFSVHSLQHGGSYFLVSRHT